MLITTSRNPTHYLRRVSKIISLSFPNSEKLNRGSLSLNKIFAYCWNKQISRLLILQEALEEDSITVKAYLIKKQPQLIEANIRISNVVSLKDKSKKQRIEVEKVNLNFSNEVNKLIRKKIELFFKSTNQESKDKCVQKQLIVNFQQETPEFLIGQAIQQGSLVQLHLFTIKITINCNKT